MVALKRVHDKKPGPDPYIALGIHTRDGRKALRASNGGGPRLTLVRPDSLHVSAAFGSGAAPKVER